MGVFVPLQVFALLVALPWALAWFGRSAAWVEGRKRGWPPLFFFAGWCMAEGAALHYLVTPYGSNEEPLLNWPLLDDFTTILGFGGTLLGLVGWLVWWPRFLLPGWVQERLKAGDPVRTARPLAEVQHLMTKPQNLEPDFTPTIEQLSLPTTIRVKTARWWFGGLFCCLGALMMLSVLFGIPADAYSEPSGSLGVLRLLSIVGLPLTLWLAVYYLRGAVRPDHITLSSTGVRATSWGLVWDEIEEVEVKGDPTSHKGQVIVRPELVAFSRERENNKWLSGRPLRLGGLASDQPYLRFQPGTDIMPGTLAEIIRQLRDWRRVESDHQQDDGFTHD
ncbi:hypothetical protein [Zhihengliuella salsuginis]|uniref:PH domain-containing protein n=1 Tax=Zhihengliuella salsuginis TaxID=578222 RepID=A0ABQ3GGP3_9MICC|nr:hypothetical protein [Zhihengliuella salsuginis]GHD05567.1 hypothetical protein GCM10008096_14650 [Zhihengliuella salsuginis]